MSRGVVRYLSYLARAVGFSFVIAILLCAQAPGVAHIFFLYSFSSLARFFYLSSHVFTSINQHLSYPATSSVLCPKKIPCGDFVGIENLSPRKIPTSGDKGILPIG